METIVNAIVLKQGEVLLGKRSPRRTSYPGCWSFVGGHVEDGETPAEALVREVEEELGITPTAYRLHATILEPGPVHFHLFLVDRWAGGDPYLRNSEHTELKWFGPSTARALEPLAIETYRAVLDSLSEDKPSGPDGDEPARISRVMGILNADARFQSMLEVLRHLSLPDAAIGAGAIRNRVWNALHGLAPETYADEDVDVLLFDERDRSTATELMIERRLRNAMPSIPWSVKNQARMHLGNGDAPYTGVEDAISRWLETPTAVAVTAEATPRLIAPHGLADLLDLRVRPTPSGKRKPERYRERIESKRWLLNWPKLVVFWD